MTQTISTPPTSTFPNPTATPPAKPKRTWKTWQLATAAVLGIIIGAAAGGGSSDTAKIEAAQAQAAAADERAANAVNVARADVERDAATRTAELDKRSAELDRRDAALDTQEAAKKASTFGDGQYQVGTDIVAGTYHTSGGRGCYWEKSTGDDIIDNENASGPVTLTIEPAVKFFETVRCGTWTKR